ncbi:type III secretion system export apparatus subunit SctT [Pandoraea terrae]|uniref:type III secretion system export apparatus subunit SctT n=1 Tax=Pandoraea terrae TaxID=1537710 RepID=UPI001CD33EA8|nr:type III secretion system export apparatus subunit SctT [Pandoraea terrae]
MPWFFLAHDAVAAASIGFVRVAPVFFMLPFLNGNVLSGVTRTAVAMWVAIGLWPHDLDGAGMTPDVPFWRIAVQEVLIGGALGCALAWPFWVFHAVGAYIDNQRGATLSSVVDPANGVDTSELANMLNLFCAAAYLNIGGMRLMLDVLARSYGICDPLRACNLSLPPVLSLLDVIVVHALVLASPVVAALLISEILLGLLSRFAPQMNAFAVSLAIKSLIAFTLLLIYAGTMFPQKMAGMVMYPDELLRWFVPAGN